MLANRFGRYRCLVGLALILSLSGYSGCSKNGHSAADSGTDTHTGSDTTDTDTDTHTDTVLDTDTETSTGPYISDAGPWKWVNNPAGEDCGPGCVQLTFGGSVKAEQWDVWNEKVVYRDDQYKTVVVDISQKKYLPIPNVFPDTPIESGSSLTQWPAIYRNKVFYSLSVYDPQPTTLNLVEVDLHINHQTVIWSDTFDTSISLAAPKELDVYGERLITTGGCGNLDSRSLCSFEPPWPTHGKQIIYEIYGGYNSIWKDIVVFFDIRTYPDDITAYDFETDKFIYITDDREYQIFPRIHENRVVYMDFRHGTSTPEGSWANVAVYLYDLTTKQTTQITSGEWIAANPDVFGDIIIWQDSRDCSNPNDKNDLNDTEVWGYNLVTEKEFKITNMPGRRKAYPRIWGDKVFIQMFRLGSTEDSIYMFDLPDEAK